MVLVKETSVTGFGSFHPTSCLGYSCMLGFRQPFCGHEGKVEPVIWFEGLISVKNQTDASSCPDPDILRSERNKALSQAS